MNTTTSTLPYALSLTITGTSGTISHTASTTLLVNLAPPAGLSATAGNAQVTLSWPASVGASGYHVKRATIDGGPYETFACPSGTSVVDSGLINGTTYYYTVSATYTGGPVAGGESANSVQASATPHGTASLAVNITNPKAATTVSGTVKFQASVTGATGSSNTFTFMVDNSPLGSPLTTTGTSSFVNWNTRRYSKGPHILSVQVQDAVGDVGTASESVTVQ
jgi:cellulose 1,4-beta-cellobiosidase